MTFAYTFLVIDDSAFIRMSATKFLKGMGIARVYSADGGKVGLEQFRLLQPDVVILDGIMPEVDGLTVLKTIKSERPKTIVVMCSSLSVREKIIEFKNAGAEYYILKPYTLEKFGSVVQATLSALEVP